MTTATASTITKKPALMATMVGAIGVVFGDIGTSPLYALKECFNPEHGVPFSDQTVYGVLSMLFWAMTLVVSIKYVVFVMRADNNGEGGILALTALAMRASGGGARITGTLMLLGLLGASMFYGDAVITPAISVLSAIEGMEIMTPALQPWVLPLSLIVLIGLFLLQKHGTHVVGRLFGPVMVIWFVLLGLIGLASVVRSPQILVALSPVYAIEFMFRHAVQAFVVFGSVFLALTGAEALYADMGHFGARPIRYAWFYIAMPCLLLNYFGQGALLLREPSAVQNPFFLLMPTWAVAPMVLLATAATVIASQAVISGAFSVTQQAIQLGFMPRMQIKHTSASTAGQIYIPTVNWGLMIMVIVLVLFFRSSSNLAAAYGIAVTGAMFIDTLLLAAVLISLWRWPLWKAIPLIAAFIVVDMAYLGANLIKVPDGGWVPLAIGLAIFTMLTTWSRGRTLMRQNMAEGSIPVEVFAKSAHSSATRVPGTSVFMASTNKGVPSALLHNIKHNKVLHERVVILTVAVQDVPYVEEADRYDSKDMGNGFYRLTIRCGFLEDTDVPALLKRVSMCGEPFQMMKTSFFLSRQTLIASAKPGMALWREKLFAWMLRNAASAMEFFRLPTNRVVELGSQLEI